MTIKAIYPNFILFVLIFMLSLVTHAQENFIPGYIIQMDGDTSRGYIDFRNWRINPEKISFKVNPQGETTVYTPVQINGFSVSGNVYQSAFVTIETSPDNHQFLETDPELKLQEDTAFLQLLVRGKKSIYHYLTRDEKNQFYIPGDSVFELLVYKKYLTDKDNNGIMYTAEYKKYAGQLSVYLNDCPTIQEKITRLQYKKQSLEKLFLFYAQCTGDSLEFVKKPDKKRTEFGFIAGTSVTWIQFGGTGKPYLYNLDKNYSVNFVPGIVIDFIRFKNNRKWSWSNELLYSGFKLEGNYTDSIDENNITRSHTVFSMLYLKWYSLIRYKFPVGKVHLYANAGISNGLGVPMDNYVYQEITFYDMERIRSEEALHHVKSYEFGLIGGFGARLKDFTLEARYEWGSGFSAVDDISTKTSRLYFLLGYRF
jgi:hypothetical protein